MSTPADQIITALRAGHEELAALVRDLKEDDLLRPSGASEWQVSQVLSHLGSGAEINLAALTAARTGAPGPDGDFNRGVWQRWDAMPPAEHAAGFLAANERLVEAYEALDADTRASLRIDLGFLPEPVDVATAGRFRLSEFALHQWDVEVAVNPFAAVTPLAVSLLLDQIGGMLGWTSRPQELAGRQATLLLRLSEPERTYGLRLGETIELVDAPEQPDGELTAPAEAWLRLAVGRLGPAYTPDGVRVTGPVTLDDLRRVFVGF
ncbi:maleylpyruvate isomerase family mycothiol-dependent enzyme [Micromonospora sp. ALFpr18c]|uniref:maleylpyruvate isomerase family mycothiol-dependent enzyme n=1 Tax=unclassified Micromonospora TaxID=2617518 RepID=UPI00124BAD01|nr:maleylpyruvate isomerase family mycothiol-dependent enzyme [Micromonospora sp. ALFpr18c]KAB1937302.1 maleylpyruvate isomerase family mycothiol-dependent enzyme [Micromonospora sp. ALFpr18c]